MQTFLTKIRNNKEYTSSINSFIYPVLYKLICVVLAFLNSILINRCLGVSLRGEYTTIITIVSLLQLGLNLGIGNAYPTFKRKYPDSSLNIFGSLFGYLLLFYTIVFLPFLFIGSDTIFFIAVISYFSTFENIVLFIAIVENVKKRNVVNIITSLLHTVFLLAAFFFFKSNLFVILWIVIVDHLVLTVSLIVSFRFYKFNRIKIDKHTLKDIFMVSIPVMLMNLLMYLNYHADVLFLSYLERDSYIVGLYGTGVTLGNMLWIVPDAFKDVLYNRSSRKDNPKEIIFSILLNILICVVIVIGFFLLGRQFLTLTYGEDYSNAYNLTLLIFLGTFPMILYKLIHPIYIANGKTRIVVFLLSLAVLCNFIGNVVLIPKFSAIGAAVSTIISYTVCGVAFLVKFYKDYNIKKIKLFKM